MHTDYRSRLIRITICIWSRKCHFFFLHNHSKYVTVVPERRQTTLSTHFHTEFPKEFETSIVCWRLKTKIWQEENMRPNFPFRFFQCVLDCVGNGSWPQLCFQCVRLCGSERRHRVWDWQSVDGPSGQQSWIWGFFCSICNCCSIIWFHPIHWFVGCQKGHEGLHYLLVL